MTEEQTVFYWIGRLTAGAGTGLIIGTVLWHTARVITDGMVVLNDKANQIRSRNKS